MQSTEISFRTAAGTLEIGKGYVSFDTGEDESSYFFSSQDPNQDTGELLLTPEVMRKSLLEVREYIDSRLRMIDAGGSC